MSTNHKYDNENNKFSFRQVPSSLVMPYESVCKLCGSREALHTSRASMIQGQVMSPCTFRPTFCSVPHRHAQPDASWGCFWPKITYPPENIFGSVVNVAQAGMTHWRENSNLSRASWLGQGQKLWAQALPEASVNLLLESFPNSKSMSSSQGSQPRPWA